jgi:coenzyme F420-reducing hydrogenase delta subunit
MTMTETFEPKVTAFVCNWCTYAGADLTGTSRIKYQSNVRVLRVPCTGRIDFMMILKAFQQGADGVIVSGCHPNDCHYTSGNYHARRRWMVFKEMMEFMGIDMNRVTFSWVSAAEGARWAQLVNEVTDSVRNLGPYAEYKELVVAGIE